MDRPESILIDVENILSELISIFYSILANLSITEDILQNFQTLDILNDPVNAKNRLKQMIGDNFLFEQQYLSLIHI